MDQGTRRSSFEGEQAALLRARIALTRFLSLAGASPALARQRAIAEARLKAISDLVDCDFRTPESVREQRKEELRRHQAEEELNAD